MGFLFAAVDFPEGKTNIPKTDIEIARPYLSDPYKSLCQE